MRVRWRTNAILPRPGAASFKRLLGCAILVLQHHLTVRTEERGQHRIPLLRNAHKEGLFDGAHGVLANELVASA